MTRSRILTLLLGIFLATTAFAADAALDSLQLEGSSAGRMLWLIEAFKPAGSQPAYSIIYQRTEGAARWELSGSLPGVAVQSTHYGDDLVLLLSDGQWLIPGISSGRPLPAGNRIVAIAGNAKSLLAIASPLPPSTQPATSPATEIKRSAQATTKPAGGLQLYELNRDKWQTRAALPQDAANPILGISQQGNPLIAYAAGGNIHLRQLGPEGGWDSLGTYPADGGVPRRLIADSGRTMICVSAPGKASQILLRDTQWRKPVPLLPPADIQTVALAGGQIRFLYVADNQVNERRLDPRTLQFESADTALVLPQPVDMDRVRWYINIGMMVIISLVMLHTYRKRDDYRHVKIDFNKLQLAPYGRRFFAGMIDLLPVMAAALYARAMQPNLPIEDFYNSEAATRLLLIGIIIYLVSTTAFEMFAGRSLGKIITNLRVVTIEGKRPGPTAMLVRNLLRVVDMVLVITMLLMAYLPLRQRMGDLAAGTTVVADRQQDLAGPDA